ncbi:MAG: RHS repeat-associated core domain-containing protein, partial [Candidatus Omnitrophota bacterium]
GRRIAKKINSTIVEKYLWEGLTKLLAVYDGSDNLVARFEYADARTPFAMMKGGVKYYLTYDQVGSLRAVTDSSGTVVKRIDYDSFGNILSDSTPSFSVPFGFAGGLHDLDTGLVRFGFRDYDPETGRWTAKDPIRFLSGETDVYGYAANNPISFTDPLGLAADDVCEFDLGDVFKPIIDWSAEVNWETVGIGTVSLISGVASVAGGSAALESTWGAVGAEAVIGGIIATGFGLGDIIVGFQGGESQLLKAREDVKRLPAIIRRLMTISGIEP